MRAAVQQDFINDKRPLLFELTSSLNLAFATLFAWYAYFFYAGVDIRFSRAQRVLVLGSYWLNSHLNKDRQGTEGVELFFIICMIGATLAFLLLLRLISRIASRRAILLPLGGILAFAAPTIAWWIALKWVVIMRTASTTPPYRIDFAILVSVALVFALLRVDRDKPIPLWRSALVLCLNYAMLGWYVFPMALGFQIHSPMIFSLAWPAAGMAWIWYVNRFRVVQRTQ